jgi:multimeric flavodoxin WrbA
MNVVILSSSPNTDGLTAACARAAATGLEEAGVPSKEIRLTDSDVGRCKQCSDGWGTCLREHRCQVADGFQALHATVLSADALALVTPVYWGEMSESMKAFTDRLRRCEATRSKETPLAGTWVLGVAAAGGGGGGGVTCMAQIERLCSHIGMKRFDLVGITRWTRAYQLEVIRAAAQELGRTIRREGADPGL